MATITGSTNTSVWSFKLEVVENSTSVENNSSKVTVTAYIGRPASAGASYLYGASISCPVSITGCTAKTITYNNAGQVDVAAGGWLSIGSVVFDSVPHDPATGSKTVTVSATFTSNISPASGSASGSVKLTNIARASTFTIDKTKIYANGTDKITVTINAKNTAYKHTIIVAMGGLNQTFNVPAGVTTYAFTVPYDWLYGIPAQESSNVTTIVLNTYNGTTLVGSTEQQKCFTVWCPDDVKPVVTSVTRTGNNLRDGVYAQGKSTATIKTVAGGSYGSKIVSYACTVDGVKYTTSEFTTLPFKAATDYTIEVTVTDSRGRSAKGTATKFTVYEYKPPYITSFAVERDATTPTTVKATLVGGVSALNNKNTKSFTVTLNGKTETITSTGYTVNGSVNFTGIDTDSTFVATAKVADYYGDSAAATMPVVVPTEAVTVDYYKDGKGVAFGKVAEESGLLDVAWPMKSPSVDNLLGGYGMAITSGTDLNTPAYLKVGTYVCNTNAVATGLKNCPTSSAFKMTVTNVIYKNPTPSASAAWYLVREIMNLYGYKYYQYVHSNGTGGWSYGTWFVRLDGFWVKDYIIEQGTYSDGWEYAKWNNGRIELWADKSLSFPATTQEGTYVWRTFVQIDMSSKLTKIIGGNCPVQHNGAVPQLCRNGSTPTMAEIMILTGRTLEAFTLTVPIYIIGKWK